MDIAIGMFILAIIVIVHIRLTCLAIKAIYYSAKIDRLLQEKGMLGMSDPGRNQGKRGGSVGLR